jgi:hypothetical protein
LLNFASTTFVWWIYVAVLLFLAYRMAFPPKQDDSKALEITDRTRVKAGFFSAAIGIFAGFLGVGPGFLMMPTLVMLGYTARLAAATNRVIVTLPSFSAFITHLPNAQFDWTMLILTSITAVVGAWLGARFMAKRVKSLTLSRIFAAALLVMKTDAQVERVDDLEQILRFELMALPGLVINGKGVSYGYSDKGKVERLIECALDS